MMLWLYVFLLVCSCSFSSSVKLSRSSSVSRKYLSDSIKKTNNKENGADTMMVASAKGVAQKSLNAFDMCICGAIATAIGDFTLHPIDTIKVIQQSSDVAIGFMESIKMIISRSGPLGFYDGVGAYVLGDGLSGAVKFATFEVSKKFLESRLPAKFYSGIQFVCAGISMLACSIILVPGEVLKTRLQTGAIDSLIGGVQSILKTEGIKGLFTGYNALLVRDLPYTILELGLYENIKHAIKLFKKVDQIEQKDELLAGAITGAIVSFATTPLDLVKTKLMLSGSQYTGFLDAWTSVYQSGGIEGLFVGSAARVAWLLPFTTIYLGVYESLKRRLLIKKNSQEML